MSTPIRSTTADPNLELVVLGRARMRWANVYGAASVVEDWELEQVLFGIDHGCRIRVGGTLRTPLLLLDDKTVDCGARAVEITYSSRVGEGDDESRLRAALVPELIDDGDDAEYLVRLEPLFQRLDAGRSIYQARK
jgi:hypothetical protein